MLKKKIFIFAVTLVFILSCFAGVVSAADTTKPAPDQQFGPYSFEEGAADMKGFFTTFLDSDIRQDPLNSTNQVGYFGTDCVKGSWATTFTTAPEKIALISFDFYMDQYTASGTNGLVRIKTNSWRKLLTVSDSSHITLFNGTNAQSVAAAKWYSVKYIFDFTKSKVYYYFGETGNTLSYIADYNMTSGTDNSMTQFQIVKPSDDFYIDNLNITAFGTICDALQECLTAEDVKAVIEFYTANKLIDTQFNILSSEQKAEICGQILENKTSYTDEETFVAAIDSLIAANGDGGTVYHRWDFTQGTLEDLANSENVFMSPDSSIETLDSGSVAKVSLTSAAEKLVNTNALKNAIGSGTVKYVSYNTKLAKTGAVALALQIRSTNATRNTIAYKMGSEADMTWDSFKTVFDLTNHTGTSYKYADGAWNIYDMDSSGTKSVYSISDFDGASIRLNYKNQSADRAMYFEYLDIKGYDDFYAEINAATVDNVLNVVNAFWDMQIISFPDAYLTMDASQKQALAALLKATEWTQDIDPIACIYGYLSENELVPYSAVTTADVLSSASFFVNKEVSATSGIAIFASYDEDNALIDVKKIAVDNPTKGKLIEANELNLNVTNAEKIKYMLWSDDSETLRPITASTVK